MISPSIISGAVLGWALGSNGAANCFAAAVSTRIIKYRTAIIFTAIFVVLGARLEGGKGVQKISDYSYNSGINTPIKAFLVMLAAAITITLMTIMHLPVSTSQAVIGAIIGGALIEGKADFSEVVKFFYAWFITPFGAIIISFILYKSFELFIEKRIKDYIVYDKIIKVGYYVSGMFSAYSLGGNNVANVTSIYAGKINLLTTNQAVFIGGLTIALGVLTYSRGVMKTVGENLVALSPVSGLISVLTGGIVVYIYTQIGIPVSASHAIVGAVIGIGLVKGINTIRMEAIRNILFGWFGTPTIAGMISLFFFSLLCLNS